MRTFDSKLEGATFCPLLRVRPCSVHGPCVPDYGLESDLSISDLVTTAWAAVSAYRGTDKRGGADGARIRSAPQKDWEVNEPKKFAKVVKTLEKIRKDFNESHYARDSAKLEWTATRVELIFGSNSQLRALAEAYASADAEKMFVRNFVAVWNTVMNLDRFDLDPSVRSGSKALAQRY